MPLVCKRWDAVTAGSVQLWRRFDLRWRCAERPKIAAFEQWVARRPHLRPRALAARLVGESATGGVGESNDAVFRDEVLPVVLVLGPELRSLELELEVGTIRPAPWALQLPALSSLALRCRCVEALPSLARASCLTELRIDALSVALHPGCIPPTLHELRLARCALPAGRCTLLACLPPSLAAATALTALHLEAVTVSSTVTWADAVAALWTLTQLRRLHYPRTGDATASPGLSCLTALTRLTLRADPAVDAHGPAFAAFSTLQQLRVLDLAECMVNEVDYRDLLCIAGVEQLVLSSNPDLYYDGDWYVEGGVLALRTLELDVRAAAIFFEDHPLLLGACDYPRDLYAVRFTAGGASPGAPDANALVLLLRHVIWWSTSAPPPPAAKRLVHFDEGAIEAAGGLGTTAARELVELARVARVVFGAAAESEVPWVRQV